MTALTILTPSHRQALAAARPPSLPPFSPTRAGRRRRSCCWDLPPPLSLRCLCPGPWTTNTCMSAAYARRKRDGLYWRFQTCIYARKHCRRHYHYDHHHYYHRRRRRCCLCCGSRQAEERRERKQHVLHSSRFCADPPSPRVTVVIYFFSRFELLSSPPLGQSCLVSLALCPIVFRYFRLHGC